MTSCPAIFHQSPSRSYVHLTGNVYYAHPYGLKLATKKKRTLFPRILLFFVFVLKNSNITYYCLPFYILFLCYIKELSIMSVRFSSITCFKRIIMCLKIVFDSVNIALFCSIYRWHEIYFVYYSALRFSYVTLCI